MKNFTKQITNKTLFKPTRWLLMALMMLVGTSSAWAVDYYLRGTFNDWSTNNKFLSNTCTITLAANQDYTFKIAASNWNNNDTYGKTNSHITETCEIELLNNTNNQAAGDCKITTKDAGNYTFVFTPNGSKGTLKVTYPTPTPTAPVVATTSAVIDGENLVCEGKVTSMGAASTVVWAFTVLSTDAISKAHSDWKYPDGQNQITAANTDFEYSIPISSLSLTSGTTYYVRAMAVDLKNLGWADNQYGNAVAGDAISFVYDPCIKLPDDAYALSRNYAEWTGRDITPTISKKDENYPTPTITYNGGSALPNKTGEYTIKATVSGDATYCNKEFDLGTFTITCPTIAAPDITASATVCAGTQVTLSNYNGVNDNTVKWYSDEECNSEVTKPVTPTNGTVYYAKAYDEASGCSSSEYSTLTFTVNPLPIISISGSEKAVFYEDVTLTANATQGATVKWYEGGVEKATGITYVVTSATEPSKTVTAKAFLNGCESAVESHTVAFSAEDCADVTKKDLQPVGKSKITCQTQPDNWGKLYCYAWTIEGDKIEPNGYWPGKEITKDDPFVVDVKGKKFKVVFHNGNGTQTADSQELFPDKIYLCSLGDNGITVNENGIYKENVDVTVPHEKVAPTVKTVSVTSNEDGLVTLTGMVVTTGCNEQAKLGLQYKKQNQDGSYEANYHTVPNPGTLEAISAGKTYTTQVTLEDGTYTVRARIDVDGTLKSYGKDIIIEVNTTKTAISDVEINYSDIKGTIIAKPDSICKGATAYVRLDYTGSKYSDIKWLVEGVETNLVTDEGNHVWSYEIQGTGQLSVELRNDANKDNEDNPTWATSDKLSFTMKKEPTAPYISIDPASGVICQGSSATIKVENPSTACSYKLVEENSKADFTPYKSGDLKYTVQNVAKYYVVAQHNACTANEYTSNQVAINQIISTNANISIDPAKAETTPWEPVTITVKPDAGYIYELTYTDGNLAAVDGVRIKQNGDSYTYYIPRPDAWTTGDSDPVRDPINYVIKAQLKVDGEESECKLKDAAATIQLKDEDNEDCPK